MQLILVNSIKDQSELIKNNHTVHALICKIVYQPLKLNIGQSDAWLYSACYLDHCELRCILYETSNSRNNLDDVFTP